MKKRDQGRIEVLKKDKVELDEKLVRAEHVLAKTEERFKQQVGLLEARHQEGLSKQRLKFDNQIAVSNEKIVRVEDEMRQILLEQENEKRKLEEKYRHIGDAFKLLQKG